MLELLTGTTIDLAHSGARHGEGLFETIRIRHGIPLRLPAHLQRLAAGAEFLGLAEPPDLAGLLAFLAAHTRCQDLQNGVLRLLAVDGQLQVTVAPWQPDPPAFRELALSLQIRRLSGDPLTCFKTLSYLDNRLLVREAQQRGLFEVIAPNELGRLSDGGRCNLFLLIQGRLLTPPVADGALPGVARRSLLEAGLAEEAPLAAVDLDNAQAHLLTNALRGAIPMHGFQGRLLDARHPLLLAAAEALEG